MLWQTNGWLIIAVVIGAFLAATEIGYRLGHRQRDPDEAGKSHISALQGGLLGLMALLLAFSISMSVSRFDKRKSLVVEEANAIGTTWLRSQFLTEEAARESAQLLRDYVAQRLEFFSEDINETRQDAATQEASRILARLWQIAVAEAQQRGNSETLALYIETLNQTIDLGEWRLAARTNQLPETILYALFAVAICGLAFIGYGTGMSGRRRMGSSVIFALLVTVVLVVILDMDRPRRGFIQVGQGSMLRLQQSMAETIAP
jgi:hypothetical protein